MDKTIRVIDLLNKIANGEEVPEKIKYENELFEYREIWEQYVSLESHGKPLMYLISQCNYSCFNDTVKIIEEQQDIDIQELEEIKDVFIENSSCGEDVKYLARKYNELVQAVKQLDKNIKDKE